MAPESPPLHHTILVVDIERWTDPSRTDEHRRVLHLGLFAALRQAFADVAVDWALCTVENTGDGMIVLVPAQVSGSLLVDRLPSRITAAVRRHNEVSALEARMRLRFVLHEGPVRKVPDGQIGSAIAVACRLLDSDELRAAHKASDEPITLMVSDGFYRNVVAHDPAAEPRAFREVRVSVKGMRETAWIRSSGSVGTRPGDSAPAEPPKSIPQSVRQPVPPPVSGELAELADALQSVPSIIDERGRLTVLGLLPAGIAGAIPSNARTRPYVIGLILACLDYEDGLAQLYKALVDLEGESLPMRRLHAALSPWT
ncbi:hypothetical protein [Actinosynnema sp. NPDC023587]|uniref:effector-associated domain 2-containing protein n=1 Tax=Actinosynnema sp. NPDC023587 TaxID=3154695 RepID=UPI0033E83B07